MSGPWRSAPRAEDAPAAPGPAEAPVELRTVRRHSPRHSTALWATLGGLIAAVGVVAALMLWPEPSGFDQAQAPTATAPTAAVPTDPAVAAIGAVRLRAPETLAPARMDAIVAALREGGVGVVEVEPLPFAVGTSRVGYYLAHDRAAAEALSRLMAPLVAPGGALPLRDYGRLTDDPEPGRLDLWVSG